MRNNDFFLIIPPEGGGGVAGELSGRRYSPPAVLTSLAKHLTKYVH
jgi:hypothetical protein